MSPHPKKEHLRPWLSELGLCARNKGSDRSALIEDIDEVSKTTS
jgi:hypothetical protein